MKEGEMKRVDAYRGVQRAEPTPFG